MTVGGVESVSAFSEVKLILTLVGGERMCIVGSGLKITAFSKQSGDFSAEGEFIGFSYGGKSFLSKLFK